MTADRWERLHTLFGALAEASPAERAARLAAGDIDAELAGELADLLAAHDRDRTGSMSSESVRVCRRARAPQSCTPRRLRSMRRRNSAMMRR